MCVCVCVCVHIYIKRQQKRYKQLQHTRSTRLLCKHTHFSVKTSRVATVHVRAVRRAGRRWQHVKLTGKKCVTNKEKLYEDSKKTEMVVRFCVLLKTDNINVSAKRNVPRPTLRAIPATGT